MKFEWGKGIVKNHIPFSVTFGLGLVLLVTAIGLILSQTLKNWSIDVGFISIFGGMALLVSFFAMRMPPLSGRFNPYLNRAFRLAYRSNERAIKEEMRRSLMSFLGIFCFAVPNLIVPFFFHHF